MWDDVEGGPSLAERGLKTVQEKAKAGIETGKRGISNLKVGVGNIASLENGKRGFHNLTSSLAKRLPNPMKKKVTNSGSIPLSNKFCFV